MRVDGRALDQIRPLSCDVGILPRVHGTGLFQRGQTQVLTACTLAPLSKAQVLDGLDAEGRSADAAHKLIALGYTKVYDFGGIIDWPYETEK